MKIYTYLSKLSQLLLGGVLEPGKVEKAEMMLRSLREELML